MTALTQVAFGAASDGSQGDSTRTAFTKVNSNTTILDTQATLTSVAATITAPQALTVAQVGNRVNINLPAAGTINLPAASTCAADNVILLRNLGATVVTLAITTGSGDTLSLTTLDPGASALMDTDGVHGWNCLSRGRSTGANQTVAGNNTVTGNETVGGTLVVTGNETVGGALTVAGEFSANAATPSVFAARPMFNGLVPWDAGNLSAAAPLAVAMGGNGAHPSGRQLLGTATVTVGSPVLSVIFDGLFTSEFIDYELEICDICQASAGPLGLAFRFTRAGVGLIDVDYAFNWFFGNETQLAFGDGNGATSYIELYNGQQPDNGTGLGQWGKINIFDPLGVNHQRALTWQFTGSNGGGTASYMGSAVYFSENWSDPLTGVQVLFTAGNIARGVVKLYGLRR